MLPISAKTEDMFEEVKNLGSTMRLLQERQGNTPNPKLIRNAGIVNKVIETFNHALEESNVSNLNHRI